MSSFYLRKRLWYWLLDLLPLPDHLWVCPIGHNSFVHDKYPWPCAYCGNWMVRRYGDD